MFDLHQQATLKSLCDTLIPPDEFPGGWEAGVGDYVLALLASPDGVPYRSYYQEGFARLDQEMQLHCGQSFCKAAEIERTELLLQLERGETKTGWREASTAVQVWSGHAAEGYYNNPFYGGNHHFVSWNMIGFPIEVSLHYYPDSATNKANEQNQF